MYTSMVLVALSSFSVSAAEIGEPTWKEYVAARKLGQTEKKPLAVFVGSGKAGWNKLSQDGKLGKETKRLLANHYICAYVNTDEETGKRLAADLEFKDSPGIVISDHEAKVQAFRHDGELADDDLNRFLRRYADPERAVRTTETKGSERVSYYPADNGAPAAQPGSYPYYGGYYAPSYGGFGGGGGRGGC